MKIASKEFDIIGDSETYGYIINKGLNIKY